MGSVRGSIREWMAINGHCFMDYFILSALVTLIKLN